jgi:hypothetical protein
MRLRWPVKRRIRFVAVAVVVLTVVAVFGPWPVAAWWRDSGVTGQTEVGPTCPVLTPGLSCPPGHIGVWLVVTRDGWPSIFSISHAGAEGRFRIGLPPGRYTVRVVWFGSSLPMLRTPELHVTVRPHSFADVVVEFDSGLT